MTTITEIREGNKVLRDQAFLLRRIRPLGCYLAWGALRLRLKPLHVTYANFALGIAICSIFAWGQPAYRILAAGLLILWQALDTTDGSMARVLQQRSNYGGFIDYAGGMFLVAFLQLSLGVGLSRYPEHSVQWLLSLLGINMVYLPEHTLMLGAYSSVTAVLSRMIHKIAQTRFGKIAGDEANPAGGGLAALVRGIKNLENIGGFQIPVIFLASLLHGLELAVVFYFMINLVILVGFTLKLCVTLRHQHEYLS